jgi:UDP-2,3-diacylglucosamine hydrolase
MKNWFFIADAHISERDEQRQQRLVDFLEKHRKEMECLVILGDLFEFWFGFPDYVNPAYRPLCDTLLSLTDDGVRLIYVEGNHDFSLGPFFTERLRGEVYPRDHMFELNGKQVYMAHGDGIDPSDLGYRVYRALLKNRLIYALMRRIGPKRAEKVKRFLSERPWMHKNGALNQGVLPYEEKFVQRQCSRGADVVILAHTHRPSQSTVVHNGRECTYYNVGDWIKHFSYLKYSPESGFRLETYRSKSAPSCGAVMAESDRTCSCNG